MHAVLVDTFSAVFRAHHALPPMSTRAGEPTAALYGFSSLLMKLLWEHRGTALGFAIDRPEPTFRSLAFEGYKAGRAATPGPLQRQLARLPELLAAFAVPVLGVPGFEADDVLATLAARVGATEELLIVSGDRDLLQLARSGVRIHFIGRRGEPAVIYDEARVLERFGIPPARLPSYVALVGDVSDNLPGVPGIGAKTARALFERYSDARSLLSELEHVEPPRVRELLARHGSQILLTEQLARLRADVPLPPEAPGWAPPPAAALRNVATLFAELEFKSLLPRVERLLATT